MDKLLIEKQASEMLRRIWRDRHVLWSDREITSFEVRSPKMAALVCGFDFKELPNLGDPVFNKRGTGPRVAGLIDRQANRIAISQEFPETVQLFTGAHEIGHLVLHERQVMHRDRALDGRPRLEPRSSEELEADAFAACFLMPARFTHAIFKELFCCGEQLFFDDTVAFHLAPDDIHSLLFASEDSLERELALAKCQRFNNRYFVSLADQFGVSNMAMALRIKELGLVRWP